MRIIFLLRSVVVSGGIERVMTEKANWLACHGHQVLFLTYEQGSHSLSFSLDNNVFHKDLDCPYYTVYKRNYFVRPFYKLRYKLIFKSKLKSTVTSFHSDVMVIPSNLEEFMGVAVSIDKIVPVIFECHSTNIELFGLYHTWRQRFRNYMILSYIKRCSLVVSLTEGDAQYWRKVSKRVVVVPNPLSNYPDSIGAIKKNPGAIICVARLQYIKRIDRLIEAFSLLSAKYPIWHINIYGDGDEKEKLLKLIVEKKLQNRINIYAPTTDIYKKYMESEFIVVSSDSEGFSLVLIEAMSCGIPAVTVDCPCGPSSIVENGITGLLSKMSVEDLSAKMEWMITHEIERMKFGENARIAASKYQKDIVMKNWETACLSKWNK